MDAIVVGLDAPVAVRQSRLALGLSQEEFARRLDVSFATVNRWERGRTRPRGAALAKLDSIRALLRQPPGGRQSAALAALAPNTNEFVGRSDDLSGLGQLVRRSRLVTVVGPVGVGKTRMLSEAAQRGDFDEIGPVAVAALATVGRDADVAPAVARQLGADRSTDPLAALRDYMGAEGHALILDNCEQVLPGCRALVKELLTACPALHVVATSREALGLDGEAVLKLAPLDATGAGSPAIELFMLRGALRDPQFSPDAAELADIALLCRRLDGLPLAIELAAGCLPELRPAQVIARLDQRFELLVTEQPDAPARQRELRAAIAASHDLLSSREREVFASLSVFIQPYTLDAAEAVADGTDVLLVLADLVAKSLIEVSSIEGPLRYTMLESIRAFAREQLTAAGSLDAATARLWAWCFTFAQQVERGMAGPEQETWIARASLDADNVALAIEWAIGRGDASRSIELAGAFWRYWYSRADIDRGQRLLAGALALPGPVSAAAKARALLAAGVLARHRADYGQAVTYLRQHLALAEAAGDQRAIAEALNSLAGAVHGTGETARAAQLLRRSLAYWEGSGDRRGLASALSNLGVLASDSSDQLSAREYGEQALALRLSLGNAESVAISYENLATAALRAGDHYDARQLFGETLRRYVDLGEPDGIVTALEGLAALVEPMAGMRLLVVAERERARIGVPLNSAAAEFQRGVDERLVGVAGASTARAIRAEAADMTLADAIRLAESELGADPPVAPQRVLRRRLTAREREVLEHAAAGRTTKEIARALRLSSRTVDRHLANIYAKIGARGRADAIAFALRTSGH